MATSHIPQASGFHHSLSLSLSATFVLYTKTFLFPCWIYLNFFITYSLFSSFHCHHIQLHPTHHHHLILGIFFLSSSENLLSSFRAMADHCFICLVGAMDSLWFHRIIFFPEPTSLILPKTQKPSQTHLEVSPTCPSSSFSSSVSDDTEKFSDISPSASTVFNLYNTSA